MARLSPLENVLRTFLYPLSRVLNSVPAEPEFLTITILHNISINKHRRDFYQRTCSAPVPDPANNFALCCPSYPSP